MGTPIRRNYDHRIREQVILGNTALVQELDIPRSTAKSWLARGRAQVVSLDGDSATQARLRARISVLERRIAVLSAVVRLLLALVGISGFTLQRTRLPEGVTKRRLLKAIHGARKALSLNEALRVLHLSPARYHSWVQTQGQCTLTDQSSCPRTMPRRLTQKEIDTIRDMVQSKEHRHMSIRTLALYAQRTDLVFAHPNTWQKLVQARQWRRPRLRLHPPKPKIGVRASKPNEAWHVDVSVVRLLDGTKAYVHAVIDNFSRRILAWKVADRLNPMRTCEVLEEAAQGPPGLACSPSFYVDAGIENINRSVDAFIARSTLTRVLTQVDVSFSNSMVEAWWCSLKHQWLYLHSLDTVATVRKLVAFYVMEHNSRMPHSAFRGQTPDEMYFGTGTEVVAQLTEAARRARDRHIVENRGMSCGSCSGTQSSDRGDNAARSLAVSRDVSLKTHLHRKTPECLAD